jgi:GNAT superfamily N-acetyltransferase
VDLVWRAPFADADVQALHAEGFADGGRRVAWRAQLERHSLGWVCASEAGRLVGFVNVAWDGGAHAFVLDTLVARTHRRRGIGRELLAVAARESRRAGCAWLHVDFEDELGDFYVGAGGFRPTAAGVLALR